MPSPTSLPTSGPQRLCVRFRSLQPAASGLASSGCERALFTCHLGRSGMRNAECNALTGKARSQHTLPLSPPHTLTKPLLCVRLDHGRALRDCLAARDGRALHPRPPPPPQRTPETSDCVGSVPPPQQQNRTPPALGIANRKALLANSPRHLPSSEPPADPPGPPQLEVGGLDRANGSAARRQSAAGRRQHAARSTHSAANRHAAKGPRRSPCAGGQSPRITKALGKQAPNVLTYHLNRPPSGGLHTLRR